MAAEGELVQEWDAERSSQGLAESRKIGQIPICWGRDEDAAKKRAHELFRWFGGGWHVVSPAGKKIESGG